MSLFKGLDYFLEELILNNISIRDLTEVKNYLCSKTLTTPLNKVVLEMTEDYWMELITEYLEYKIEQDS